MEGREKTVVERSKAAGEEKRERRRRRRRRTKMPLERSCLLLVFDMSEEIMPCGM